MRAELSNNRLESDGLPFRCAPGQAAAQAKRYATKSSTEGKHEGMGHSYRWWA